MKIGILTFHNSRNYGAVLQAYGLRTVLENMGHKVEVVDYRNPYLEKDKHPFSFSSFKANPVIYVRRLFCNYINYRRKVRNFETFGKKFLNVTTHRFTPEDIKHSDYEVLIVGSDQVWNPSLTGGPDSVYWGKFKPQNARMITYAASSGEITLLKTEDFRDIDKWLERFDAISVREERLKSFVDSHSKIESTVVVDPTILAGRNIFEHIAFPRIIKERYVLVYSVEGLNMVIPHAKKIAELYRAKIIRTGSSGLSAIYQDLKNNITYKNANVQEMLSLIKYAECVIALSFHGTALSLLFEKDFYSIKGNNMARVESILKKCNLTDRIIEVSDDLSLKNIDYSDVRPVLINLSEDSKKWLTMSLESVVK